MAIFVALTVKGALFGIFLWLAARVTGNQASPVELIVIGIVSVYVGLIPTIGSFLVVPMVLFGLVVVSYYKSAPDSHVEPRSQV